MPKNIAMSPVILPIIVHGHADSYFFKMMVMIISIAVSAHGILLKSMKRDWRN